MTIEARPVNSTLEVVIRGRLCYSDHHEFSYVLMELDEEPYSEVAFDLSDAVFLDSAALGMVLLLKEKATEKGIRLRLHNLSNQPKKLLDLLMPDHVESPRSNPV